MCRHLKATIPVHRPHGLVRATDLGADCSRHRETHRAETPRVHPGVRLFKSPVLARPHLVLADTRDHDRAVGCAIAQLFQTELWLQRRTGFALVVGKRELLAPPAHAAAPRANVGLLLPRLQQVIDRLHDFFDHETAIAHNRHIWSTHFALLGRVDVNVNDLRVRSERRHLAGNSVVETRTERDEQVALLQRRDRGCRAVHAGHTETQRMRIGERTARHQRRDNRNLRELSQLAQRTGSASLQHTTTDIEHRLLGGEDHARGFFNHLRVALHVRAIARQAVEHFVVTRPVPLHRVLQHVFRQVDKRRARSTCRRDVKCLPHDHGDVLCAHHQFVVFGDAAGDADRVALLKRIGADRRRRNLAGDTDHRNRVHICVTQRRHEIRRSRTTRHHRDARTTSDVCVTLGHVTCTLLVSHKNVANRRLKQRVVRRENATARQPEHHLDVLVLE